MYSSVELFGGGKIISGRVFCLDACLFGGRATQLTMGK